VTLAGADCPPDRPDRSRVAELVLGETERVECCDLGLRLVTPASNTDRALCQKRSRGRVGLDSVECRLRELQRIVPSDRHCHTDRCIRTLTTSSECS
jgi:hypothetical protein